MTASPDMPRIDTPCPLDADAQRAIDGHCSHCDRHVHRLDAMSACERRALFANATGPICVSYRRPVPRRVGRIGAVIAATLITTAAQAGDPPPPPPPTVADALQAMKESPDASDEILDVLVLGGIRAPQALLEEEDATQPEPPELPVRNADDIAPAQRATFVAPDATPSPQARR
jgi:hypothetical protein